VSSTAAVAAAKPQGREMSLSTLVHLLGLSTASQTNLLETKVEALNTKISALLLKLDRVVTELGAIKADAAVDRIDFQITEIRALLKRMVPAGTAANEIEAKPNGGKSASGRAKILTSEVSKGSAKAAKPETKIVEPDNLEEFNNADDASYQAEEAQRVRTQLK
jgi:outer membrane murein-binding lipoprotein Lpp